MCDFKPGDEVVCVDAADCPELIEGAPYIVERTLLPGDIFRCRDGVEGVVATPEAAVWVFGGFDFRDRIAAGRCAGYYPSRFRKVERKTDSLSIESFLTIKPGYEEPRRTKAPAKRERV